MGSVNYQDCWRTGSTHLCQALACSKIRNGMRSLATDGYNPLNKITDSLGADKGYRWNWLCVSTCCFQPGCHCQCTCTYSVYACYRASAIAEVSSCVICTGELVAPQIAAFHVHLQSIPNHVLLLIPLSFLVEYTGMR